MLCSGGTLSGLHSEAVLLHQHVDPPLPPGPHSLPHETCCFFTRLAASQGKFVHTFPHETCVTPLEVAYALPYNNGPHTLLDETCCIPRDLVHTLPHETSVSPVKADHAHPYPFGHLLLTLRSRSQVPVGATPLLSRQGCRGTTARVRTPSGIAQSQ